MRVNRVILDTFTAGALGPAYAVSGDFLVFPAGLDLGQLAARLIGARRPLEFKKGGICRIDLDGLPINGPGHLRWFVTPRMLRRAAK